MVISIDNEKYKDAISVDAVNEILRDYLKEEHSGKIAVR